jgi:hypothetical protein
MTTITDMVNFVVSDPTVSSLIGSRLYPLTLPQEPTFPAVTYLRVSRPHQHIMEGGEVVWPMLQFDCYASTYLDAETLVHALDDAFGRWKSVWGQPAFGETIRDMAEPTLPPIGARFRKILEVTIWGLV